MGTIDTVSVWTPHTRARCNAYRRSTQLPCLYISRCDSASSCRQLRDHTPNSTAGVAAGAAAHNVGRWASSHATQPVRQTTALYAASATAAVERSSGGNAASIPQGVRHYATVLSYRLQGRVSAHSPALGRRLHGKALKTGRQVYAPLHTACSGGQQCQLLLLLRRQHSTVSMQQASGVGWGEAAARVAYRRLQVSLLRLGLPVLTWDGSNDSWRLAFHVACGVLNLTVVVVHLCRS